MLSWRTCVRRSWVLLCVALVASKPLPQDNVGVALFSPSTPTCDDPSTIPAGVEMKGVASPDQTDFYDKPQIVGPQVSKGGRTVIKSSLEQTFSIQFGIQIDIGKVSGIGVKLTFGIGWSTSSKLESSAASYCALDDCRPTFAAHLLHVAGGSYIDMNNDDKYDPNDDIGPDNDQSCHDRIWVATAPIVFTNSNTNDGRYDVCYVNGPQPGPHGTTIPHCVDLDSQATAG